MIQKIYMGKTPSVVVNKQPKIVFNQYNNYSPLPFGGVGNQNTCPICDGTSYLDPQGFPQFPQMPQIIIGGNNGLGNAINGVDNELGINNDQNAGVIAKLNQQIGKLTQMIQQLLVNKQGQTDEIEDINDKDNIFTPKEDKQAKHDKKIVDIANKLDKAGIDKELVDKFQDLLTGENYENNLTGKDKKAIDKILKDVSKLLGKTRLTAGDKEKVTELINKAIEIADKSAKTDDAKKPDAPKEPDEPKKPNKAAPAPAPAQAPAPSTDENKDKKIDMNKVNEAWGKISEVMLKTDDNDKVKALKKYTENLSDEEFAKLIQQHKEVILDKIFKGIDDNNTYNYIEKRLRTAANNKGGEIEELQYTGLARFHTTFESTFRNHISKCIDKALS